MIVRRRAQWIVRAPRVSTPGQSWSVHAVSVVKPGNDSYSVSNGADVVRANEDRWRVTDDGDALLAAVADGAGASGLFCGPWAQALVDRLPTACMDQWQQLDDWLAGVGDSFRQDQQARLGAQSVQRTKFIREGSYATLMAAWLQDCAGQVTLRWLGYGDSMMLVFVPGTDCHCLQQLYPVDWAAIQRSPFLLNWKDIPQRDALAVGQAAVPAGAIVALASDALGQYLLLRYLASPQGRDHPLWGQFQALQTGDSKLADLAKAHGAQATDDWAQDWDRMRTAMASPADFAQWVQARHRAGLMANDDSTLVVIEIAAAPEIIAEMEEPDVLSQSDGL